MKGRKASGRKGARQIPFLHEQRRADGSSVWHWKPSPRLRKLGWTNRMLGTDRASAIAWAIDLNRQLDEWEEARTGAAAPAVPKRRTFADLLAAYRQSPEYDALAPATQVEYEVRLRFLEAWALDGRLPLVQLDTQMVRDLKTALLAKDADGQGGSLHRAGAIMRVLRLLLNWSIAQGWLTVNPTDKIKIPTPPSRRTLLLESEVEALAAQLEENGFAAVGLGVILGLWTLQREEDLLAATRLNWRALDNVAPADAAVLANSKGNVMGLRLRQQKTGAWVDCPVPPFLHDRIEAAFKRGQYLIPDDADLSRPCPNYLFQRRIRAARADAGLMDRQFRDLRRSGMTMLSDLGASLPGITAISGHAVLGRKTILDTYMPGNTRAACAAMATALRTRTARQQKEGQADG